MTNLDNYLYFYEIKMNAFGQYSDRVWSRFNWFVTLQSAAFGLFFSKNETINSDILIQDGFIIAVVLLAFLWLFMGYQDFLSLDRHKIRTRLIESMLLDKFQHQNSDLKKHLQNIEHNSNKSFRQTSLLFITPLFIIFGWVTFLLDK